MKRFLIIALIVIAVLVGAVFLFGGQIKGFIRAQIESIAGDILNPRLVIGDLNYRFPFTIIITDLALVQDEVKIVEVPRCTIVLDRIPYTQGQVRFAEFNLESPVLRLTIDEKGDLVGWGDLLKPSEGDSSSDSDSDTSKTSDAFAVRKIVISNASIEFTEASRGEDKMTLDEINLAIDAHPSGSSDVDSMPALDGAPSIPEGAGWYRITTKLDRSPLIEIDVDGGLDIDSGDILLRSLAVTAAVKPENASVLPPQVQAFVRTHDIRGSLKLTSSGSIVAEDPLKGPLNLDITLDDATIGSDTAKLDVQSIHSTMNLRDNLFTMKSLDGKLLGGSLEADAELLLVGEPPQSAHRPEAESETESEPAATIPGRKAYSLVAGLQLVDIDLQKLTSTRPPSDQILGKLNVDVEMAGIATELPNTLKGEGSIGVTQGRFTSIPIISALGRAMQVVLAQSEHNDRADVTIELRPDGVVLRELAIIAGLMAAHGRGVIRFDDTLDLVVNGGPLERVQASLGAVGRALGSLTDRIVRYQITGSLDSPSVRVRPLGISVGDPTAPPPPAQPDTPETGDSSTSPP